MAATQVQMTAQEQMAARASRPRTANGARQRLLATIPVTQRRLQLAVVSTAVLEGGDAAPSSCATARRATRPSDEEDVMAGSARAPRVCDPRKVQTWHWSRLGLFGVLLAEFRRAVAAEQRYEHLKRASAACLARDGIAPADIPRRIFEEFYSLSAKPRSEAPSTALGANLLLESDCLSAVRSDPTDSTRVSTLAPTLASTHARYR